MKGKFYGVGIGPGDPDLITLKAINILSECDYVIVPKSKNDEKSTAFSIAEKHIKKNCNVLEVSFPMSRDKYIIKKNRIEIAESICKILDGGFNAAFITLGDPTIYSTCMYEYKILSERGYECEIIPGITSFCAAAAKSGVSLCEDNESFAVIPAFGGRDISEIISDNIDNFVIMKAYKNIDEIKNVIEKNEISHNVSAVTKCGLKGERVFKSIAEIDNEGLSYFTTIIVKRKGR